MNDTEMLNEDVWEFLDVESFFFCCSCSFDLVTLCVLLNWLCIDQQAVVHTS